MKKSNVKEIKSSNWDNLNHISHIFFLAYMEYAWSLYIHRLIELYMYNKENESYNVWMFIQYQSWTLWKFESNKYQRNHTYGYIIKDILKALIVYISIAIKHHVVKISKKAVTIILVKWKLNTYIFFFVHLKKKKMEFLCDGTICIHMNMAWPSIHPSKMAAWSYSESWSSQSFDSKGKSCHYLIPDTHRIPTNREQNVTIRVPSHALAWAELAKS